MSHICIAQHLKSSGIEYTYIHIDIHTEFYSRSVKKYKILNTYFWEIINVLSHTLSQSWTPAPLWQIFYQYRMHGLSSQSNIKVLYFFHNYLKFNKNLFWNKVSFSFIKAWQVWGCEFNIQYPPQKKICHKRSFYLTKQNIKWL